MAEPHMLEGACWTQLGGRQQDKAGSLHSRRSMWSLPNDGVVLITAIETTRTTVAMWCGHVMFHLTIASLSHRNSSPN